MGWKKKREPSSQTFLSRLRSHQDPSVPPPPYRNISQRSQEKQQLPWWPALWWNVVKGVSRHVCHLRQRGYRHRKGWVGGGWSSSTHIKMTVFFSPRHTSTFKGLCSARKQTAVLSMSRVKRGRSAARRTSSHHHLSTSTSSSFRSRRQSSTDTYICTSPPVKMAAVCGFVVACWFGPFCSQ